MIFNTAHFVQPMLMSILQQSSAPKLASHCGILFDAKKAKNLSFETIAKHLGREEVSTAAMFYGHTPANEEDLKKLAEILEIPEAELRKTELMNFPDRGRSLEMPPREPLVYRLYEIVQNYGYAYKSVINEKFGDGIMSAISFSTKVEKETDEKGEWVKITLRGKWYAYVLCLVSSERRLTLFSGFPSLASKRISFIMYIGKYESLPVLILLRTSTCQERSPIRLAANNGCHMLLSRYDEFCDRQLCQMNVYYYCTELSLMLVQEITCSPLRVLQCLTPVYCPCL
jgi:cyanate lyase